MGLINQFLNLVAPPTTLFTLVLFLPPFYVYKLFLSLLSSIFSESIANKVVVITGASSAIGEQLAYQYAKRGAALVLVARSEKALREVAEKAKGLGCRDVLIVPGDVAKAEDCKRFIDETMNHFGRLDHLVNNAGIGHLCMFEDAPDLQNLFPVMDVNFWGSIYPTYFAIPHLKKTKGRVVVNASATGWLPMPRMGFYNASKAAIINFYETLRMEFGLEIKITIATPGWMESEMTKGKFLPKEGEVIIDPEMRDVAPGAFLVAYAEECAKAIVRSACRGERYVTYPPWFRVLFLYKVFCPEIMEWWYRVLYVPSPGGSERSTVSKKPVDATGAKDVLDPSSPTHEAQIKKD